VWHLLEDRPQMLPKIAALPLQQWAWANPAHHVSHPCRAPQDACEAGIGMLRESKVSRNHAVMLAKTETQTQAQAHTCTGIHARTNTRTQHAAQFYLPG